MSLDLSVLVKRKISPRFQKSVHNFLMVHGFFKDEYCYSFADENFSVDVYINLEQEEDDSWEAELIDEIGFVPVTQLSLESRHNPESHALSYHFAKELAKLVDGVIFDRQVAVLYDCEGRPYACYRTDDKLKPYGAGAELFEEAVSLVRDLVHEIKDEDLDLD
jgi:hypothetical protein